MSDPPDKPPPFDLDQFFKDRPAEETEALIEMLYPGMMSAWQSLIEDVRAALDLGAARAGEPVTLSALRIIQAVAIAVRRKDVAALQAWEKITLRYMQDQALDEYLVLSLPPRAKHDRHLILAALRERIAKYLREYEPVVEPTGGIIETAINQVTASMKLQLMVQLAFPHLSLDETKKALLTGRIEEHVKTGRPLAEIDPEEVILDVLETLGVPRPTGWNWLKGAK